MDYHQLLKENEFGVLATVSQDQPYTRVIRYLFSVDGRPYFGTTRDKATFEQLQAHPQVSFCSHAMAYSGFVSLNGTVHFVEDILLKARALDTYPELQARFSSPDNPNFVLYYIEVSELHIFDFESGARKFEL